MIALTIDERGQAHRQWKTEVATRLIEDLTGNWGMRVSDIIVDCLTFPVATGRETRRDALERSRPSPRSSAATRRADHAGVSNVSFGLNPAARAVLNSVFLDGTCGPGPIRRSCVADHADRSDRRGAADRARPDLP